MFYTDFYQLVLRFDLNRFTFFRAETFDLNINTSNGMAVSFRISHFASLWYMKRLTAKQEAILDYLKGCPNRTASTLDLVEHVPTVRTFHKSHVYAGMVLKRMMKHGYVRRVKPGVFQMVGWDWQPEKVTELYTRLLDPTWKGKLALDVLARRVILTVDPTHYTAVCEQHSRFNLPPYWDMLIRHE